jgi:outer membrane protein assembly factor BamB
MKAKLTFLMILISVATFAAPSFKQVSMVTLPFSPNQISWAHTIDFKFFLCSNSTDMVMLDGVQGKILWSLNFEKEFGSKKIHNQYWNKFANVVLVYTEDSKKAMGKKFFIDGKNGKVLWSSEKYVSGLGEYELASGFSNYFDAATNCVLLPTKETVDFVDVYTGNVRWSKSFSMEGKMKEFDCFIMKYYNLVKIELGKESAIYLTTENGTEVSNIDLYYNQKKALSDRKWTTVLDIPEKNCYVIMKGHESKALNTLGLILGAGTGFQSWNMDFSCYEVGTDRLIWEKQHKIAQSQDWITMQYYVKMLYSDGKIFVEHEPNLKTNSGLTVLDVETGEKDWECYYTVTEMKGLTAVVLTPFPAPDPVVYNGFAYVVDKVKNRVFCYNLQNGTKIWESEKFPDAQKIPHLFAIDGKIILAHGAPAIKIRKTETESDYCFGYNTGRKRVVCAGKKMHTYQYIYNSEDKYGLIAYDAATGKIEWSSRTIAKAAKDKFGFIASTQYIDNKLYCATNKNFFILDPKNGAVISSIPVAKEKLGDIWGMTYFENEKQIVLNCVKGIVKVDAYSAKILGSVKTPNIPGPAVSTLINADDHYKDFAIYTKGNPKKMQYKEFASIDLEKMTIRGIDDATILDSNIDHFSDGGDMFFKTNGKVFTVYSVN